MIGIDQRQRLREQDPCSLLTMIQRSPRFVLGCSPVSLFGGYGSGHSPRLASDDRQLMKVSLFHRESFVDFLQDATLFTCHIVSIKAIIYA